VHTSRRSRTCDEPPRPYRTNRPCRVRLLSRSVMFFARASGGRRARCVVHHHPRLVVAAMSDPAAREALVAELRKWAQTRDYENAELLYTVLGGAYLMWLGVTETNHTPQPRRPRILGEAVMAGFVGSVIVGSDGYWPCRLRAKSKAAYFSLDGAWFCAWALWALGKSDGFILTPYRCGLARVLVADPPLWRAQKNPWRWSPCWILGRVRLRRGKNYDKRNACGYYHLTRSTAHILPAASEAPDHG